LVKKVIALSPPRPALTVILSEVSNANEVEAISDNSKIPLPVQGEGKRAWRARVRAVATSTSLSTTLCEELIFSASF
jgi:hypothetical protein